MTQWTFTNVSHIDMQVEVLQRLMARAISVSDSKAIHTPHAIQSPFLFGCIQTDITWGEHSWLWQPAQRGWKQVIARQHD